MSLNICLGMYIMNLVISCQLIHKESKLFYRLTMHRTMGNLHTAEWRFKEGQPYHIEDGDADLRFYITTVQDG